VRIQAALIGRLDEYLAAEAKAADTGVREGVRAAGEALKERWRGQIVQSALGQRLANTVRHKHYPNRGINAASVVYSRAAKIVDAFDRGVTIRSTNGFFLAVPDDAAGRGLGGARISPGEFEQRTGIRLRFIYRRGAPSLLVGDDLRINTRGRAVRGTRRRKGGGEFTPLTGRTTVVLFVLLPQVTITKRLDLARDVEAIEEALPGFIRTHWPETAGVEAA
jgi:hypothetical protein